MEVCALASGSSGNCFYVGSESAGVLVDAGISAKQIIERFARVGGSPEKIKAIFITHEHSDHIRGCDVLARKLNIPIFATKATAQSCFLCSKSKLVNFIAANSSFNLAGLKIESFSKSHSAADPVSFNIYEKRKVSVVTDAGYVCKNIRSHVQSCNLLFIESNHDESMLESGSYPVFLKNWIMGDEGHLSNLQAANCVAEHASKQLSRVILSHLSKVNNTPELALKTFLDVFKKKGVSSIEVNVSVREEPTKIFRI